MALSLIGLNCDILRRNGCMQQTFLGQKLEIKELLEYCLQLVSHIPKGPG